jgi:hypothetical protein
LRPTPTTPLPGSRTARPASQPHPNPDAEVAHIKAKTAALIAAYVPPPTPAKYADLKARSAALTPDQQAQAQIMFKAAFKLWQSGDYTSADLGVAQPTNVALSSFGWRVRATQGIESRPLAISTFRRAHSVQLSA